MRSATISRARGGSFAPTFTAKSWCSVWPPGRVQRLQVRLGTPPFRPLGMVHPAVAGHIGACLGQLNEPRRLVKDGVRVGRFLLRADLRPIRRAQLIFDALAKLRAPAPVEGPQDLAEVRVVARPSRHKTRHASSGSLAWHVIVEREAPSTRTPGKPATAALYHGLRKRRRGTGQPDGHHAVPSQGMPMTPASPCVGAQWPRVCALLIRLALKMTVDRFWARVLPSVPPCGADVHVLNRKCKSKVHLDFRGLARVRRERRFGSSRSRQQSC